MTGIMIGTVAFVVTTCVVLYFSVMGVLLWKLAFEGAETRRLLAQPLIPAFFQNFGIPLAILGIAFHMNDLTWVGVLLIALGLVLSSKMKEKAVLHPVIETPLLISATLSLAALGILYGF